MSNSIILHTHTVMALLLMLLVSGMYFYLRSLDSNEESKKWFQLFYLTQIVWQSSDLVRYSLGPELIGGLFYKLSVVLVTIPAVCVLQIAYSQFLYRFLEDCFKKEQKLVLYIMIFLSLIACSVNFWNEFYNNSTIEILHLIGFSLGLLFNIWAMIICFRKARFLRKRNSEAAKGNLYQGWVINLFVIPCFIILLVGMYSPIGYWSFFGMIWVGNLLQIIVFINFSAVYVNFQDKIVGFNFVIVMSVMMILALTLYPPYPPDQFEMSLLNQDGLTKLIAVILFSMVIIRFILPIILRKTLTMPLQGLLTGVQQVNEGDLNAKVIVNQSDEIGHLASNFNLMTRTLKNTQDSLKDYTENLERQVSERTKDILERNKQIESQRDSLQKTLDDLKSAQKQLIQAEKMASLGELTAGIAHEIQNPLNFVNNFSEVSIEIVEDLRLELGRIVNDITRDDTFNADQLEDVKSILKDLESNQQKINYHGKRADGIVKAMLQHSRKSEGLKELTDINLLCDEYLRLCYHGLKAKDKTFNATFLTEYDPSVGKVLVMPQELGRVILNLLNNAFYAVAEKSKKNIEVYVPTVRLTTIRLSDATRITVSDNGEGIKEEIIDRIFQPFFTTKPTGKGTGLGLSMCYDIVTKGHGGELIVSSKLNEGTTFIISIPKESE